MGKFINKMENIKMGNYTPLMENQLKMMGSNIIIRTTLTNPKYKMMGNKKGGMVRMKNMVYLLRMVRRAGILVNILEGRIKMGNYKMENKI